jgi:hypothetical protein
MKVRRLERGECRCKVDQAALCSAIENTQSTRDLDLPRATVTPARSSMSRRVGLGPGVGDSPQASKTEPVQGVAVALELLRRRALVDVVRLEEAVELVDAGLVSTGRVPFLDAGRSIFPRRPVR